MLVPFVFTSPCSVLQASGVEEKAALVLDELRQRWRESHDHSHRGDKVTMETKCEQLEEKLADAR